MKPFLARAVLAMLLVSLFLGGNPASGTGIAPHGAGHAAGAGSAATEEQGFLAAELELARTKKVYYILDVPSGRLEARARGVAMKSILTGAVGRGEMDEPRPVTGPLTLTEKTAKGWPPLPKPARTSGGVPKTSSPIMVTDMPGRYRLRFNDGTELYVFPKAEALQDHLGNAVDGAGLLLRVNCMTMRRLLGLSRRGTPRFLMAVLSGKDAQAVFWAFREGDPLLLRDIPRAD